MRILGKGKTALAIKKVYPDALIYDDENFKEFDINSDDLTVVSPGIPPYNQLVRNTKNIISDYDLFLSPNLKPQTSIPYTIWISGTNGKTTTTQMLYHLLKDKGFLCGGNIGTPLANLINFNLSTPNPQCFILETSSFTLHYTQKAKPDIYILLPISDDHISWHGSFESYEQSKLKPLDTLKKDDIAIIPSHYKDYPTFGQKICYDNSLDIASYFNIQSNKVNFKEPFLMDALLSLAITKILYDEIDYDKINEFIQDAHKLEEFKDTKGRLWIDDSKATNVDATIQALKTYKNKKIYLILGGDDKGADLNSLFEELTKYSIICFFIGSNRQKLFELSKKYHIIGTSYKDLHLAIDDINSNYTNKNDIAILSPAASSLDQYSSYKQRGEKFKELVNCLS